MEKKKTIVLTMIGLATLMLLVIGSAFAYFSITNNSGGKTETNFTGETDQLEKYGTPTITGESNLYLDLLVTDMAQGKIGTSYWATDTKENRFEPERKDHIVSTAGISGSTTEEEAYLNCTSDLTITASVKKSGEEEPLEEDIITEGDGRVYLGNQSDKTGNKASIDPNEIDLATIISETKNNDGYKTTVNYTIVGDSNINLTAAIELKNTKEDQTALAGKDIDINITNENLVCSVGEKENKAYMKKLTTLHEGVESDEVEVPLLAMSFGNTITASFVNYIPSDLEDSKIAEYIDLTDTELSPEGSVVAWIEDSRQQGEFEETLYNLYIGSDSEIYAKSLKYAFSDMSNLKEINFDNLNTSETTDMSYMFYGTSSISTLDLSNFDTSQVTDMSEMFRNSSANITFPKEFGLSATDMSEMFYYYEGTSLDLSTFDTSKVTDMSEMFRNSSANITFPKEFGLSATDMSYMFYGTSSISTLDLSNFDTSSATDMRRMFSDYKGTTLDLSNFDTSQVTDMSEMFSECTNLSNLDLSSFTFNNVKDEIYDEYGYTYSGFASTFYSVPSECVVTIKSSQREIFEDKFPLNGTDSRAFTPTYVD